MTESIQKPAKPDFEALYEEYYDRVYRYAYTILLNRENAEDVVEDTFIAAYSNYDRYDPAHASPATWLARAEREFLDLRYVMELRDAEIGELLGLPVRTVSKRYQRLLARWAA